MDQFVFPLADASATDPALAGHKGAALAKMLRAGVAVPDGFYVSTQALQLAVDQLSADLRAEQEVGSNALGPALASYNLPDALREEIRAAYNSLGAGAVSVRSSATAEDLPGASFAGQYDSFLNVISLDDLLSAVKKVWASLFSPHALSYRQRHGIAQAQMAVVVQRQLAPSAAGVLFTRDPQSGANHYLVSAALGLGEGVVSGSAPTDRFTLDPQNGHVLTADIADKHSRVAAIITGGIETVASEDKQKNKPALNPHQLETLASYGRQIEALFAAPQDIEFAAVKDAISILQARPITTLSDRVEPEHSWDAGLDDTYCWSNRRGPFYRLEQDFMVEYMRHARDCHREIGSSMAANHIVHFSNGYMYTRAPHVDEAELEKRHARQIKRIDDCFDRGTTYFEDVLRGIIEERLKELKKMRRNSSNFADLVSYLKSCMQTQGYVGGNLHWSMGRPKSLPGWHEEFHELSGRPAHEANIYLQAIDNRMTRLIAKLRELARIVQGDATLNDLFARRDFTSLATLKNNAHADRFHARFKDMLATYGLRSGRGYGSSSGFATPTWNMEPSIALDIIASYVEQDLDQLDQLEKEARVERINATRRMRRRLRNEPEKLKRFNDGLLRATLHVRFLEDHNYYMEQCTGGTAREAIFAVGQNMVQADLIERADDVLHFSLAELEALAHDKTRSNQRSLVQERRAQRAQRKKMQPPPTLGAAPEKKDDDDKEQTKRGLQGDTLVGTSAASGRANGRAVLVREGQERPHIHPGDILVATNVGPEWTPAFAILGGLVLDEGSLSQHAAIVAREYRIPSVMQTVEATKVIRDGQIIIIDGNSGIVQLTSSGSQL